MLWIDKLHELDLAIVNVSLLLASIIIPLIINTQQSYQGTTKSITSLFMNPVRQLKFLIRLRIFVSENLQGNNIVTFIEKQNDMFPSEYK